MKNQITITLAQIKEYSPSASVWSKVFKANKTFFGGDDADLNKPFPVSSILDSNGLEDTLWALRCLPEYNVLWRKFAWWCAVQVKDYAGDDRVSRCLEVVKRYCEGLATDEELSAARSEAQSEAARLGQLHFAPLATAAEATWAVARSAEESAATAAQLAAEATWAVARAAAEAAQLARAVRAAVWSEPASASAAAVGTATWSAAEAAAKWSKEAAVGSATRSEAASASAAVGLAAWSAAKSAQEIKLREILDSGTWRD